MDMAPTLEGLQAELRALYEQESTVIRRALRLRSRGEVDALRIAMGEWDSLRAQIATLERQVRQACAPVAA